MNITIKHLENEEFRTASCYYENDKLIEHVSNSIKTNKVTEVAKINFTKSILDINDILNDAYRMTNSIEDNWFENSSINVSKEARKGCRSTSKGDIIEIENRRWIVCSIGFKEISAR